MTARAPEAPRPVPLRPPRPCPICGQRTNRQTYPFCSTRCADTDLNRWLSGAYVIPGDESDDAGLGEDADR